MCMELNVKSYPGQRNGRLLCNNIINCLYIYILWGGGEYNYNFIEFIYL